MLTLDLWGVSIHAAVVFGMGKDFLFKSTPGHCVLPIRFSDPPPPLIDWVLYISFDKFLLAVESRDQPQAEKE